MTQKQCETCGYKLSRPMPAQFKCSPNHKAAKVAR